MPLSHDSKPRNRARRIKGREPRKFHSRRSLQRLSNRLDYLQSCAIDAEIAEALKTRGLKWKHYERASDEARSFNQEEARRVLLVALDQMARNIQMRKAQAA